MLVLSDLRPLKSLLPVPQIFTVDFHLRRSEFIQKLVVIDETNLEDVRFRILPSHCKHGVPALSACQPVLGGKVFPLCVTYILTLMVCQVLTAVRASRHKSVCSRGDRHLIFVHSQVQRSISACDLAAGYTMASKLERTCQVYCIVS